MGTITKLNDILCVNISKVTDKTKASISKWDDNTFCPTSPTPTPTPTQSPANVTPTPTPTMTPTPTATPCGPGCCPIELCYGPDDCSQACTCRTPATYYISLLCSTDPCIMANALGIYVDDRCGTPAPAGYYSDGVDCYYWDGSSTLSNGGPC